MLAPSAIIHARDRCVGSVGRLVQAKRAKYLALGNKIYGRMSLNVANAWLPSGVCCVDAETSFEMGVPVSASRECRWCTCLGAKCCSTK